MTLATPAAPAIVRGCNLPSSIEVEPLTCAIGAELKNVSLAVASRDAGLTAEIRALLLKHRVLFLRDQDMTRAEHVAFALPSAASTSMNELPPLLGPASTFAMIGCIDSATEPGCSVLSKLEIVFHDASMSSGEIGSSNHSTSSFSSRGMRSGRSW